MKQLKEEKEDSSFKNTETQAADTEEAMQHTIKRPTDRQHQATWP